MTAAQSGVQAKKRRFFKRRFFAGLRRFFALYIKGDLGYNSTGATHKDGGTYGAEI